MARIEELGAWPARACWVVLALVASGPIGHALDGRSTAVVVVVAVLAWAGWAAGLVALLVPRSVALTALRLLVPTSLPATVWAASEAGGLGPVAVAAVVVAVLATVSALAPWVAEEFVDGSAYGPERRTPLRTPVVFLLVLAPLAWALAVVGSVTGPLLLAAHQWAGAVALPCGWALAAGAARSMHQLARRWVVLVPAGLVLHDPLTMPEPQLFLRETVARVGPAEAGAADDGRATEDLTAGASGLVLELLLTEPVDLLVRVGRNTTTTRPVERVLFTPSRPAGVLQGARERRLPVA